MATQMAFLESLDKAPARYLLRHKNHNCGTFEFVKSCTPAILAANSQQIPFRLLLSSYATDWTGAPSMLPN
jgi:hypothetical protein